MNNFDFEVPSRPVHLVKCDECGRVFNINDGDWHVYDVDLGIYLCCKECVYDSFFMQKGDEVIKDVLSNPEYDLKEYGIKTGVK